MIGIYKIESPTGKVYIGQSWNIEDRVSKYRRVVCKGQPAIYNSLIKHGWEAHTFEIIHQLPNDITQEVLNEYETLYWQLYKDCKIQVLNVRETGSRGKHSEESKQKNREAHIGRGGWKHSSYSKAQDRVSKQCWKCKVERALTEFNRDKSTEDGFTGICKGCYKEGINREAAREYAKEHYRKKVARLVNRSYLYVNQKSKLC